MTRKKSSGICSYTYSCQNFTSPKMNYRSTKNTRARCEMCLKVTVRTPERRQWH